MKLFRSGFGVSVLSLAAIAAGYFGGRPLLERVQFDRAEADVQATRQQLSTVEDLSTVFRHVGKVVEPSVVEITVHKTVKQPRSGMNGMNEDQLRKFFKDHGMGDMPYNFNDNGNGDNGDQDQQEIGTGSGVIVESDGTYGYIVTNNHVAGDSTSIEVTLSDGRRITGSDVKLLGADPKSDLAVVQIKADRLITAQWGDSNDLEKGDWIMAFGAPFGYVGSMTHGIISALNRNGVEENSQDYENSIQVDAPINPGNSGGPLVNIHGEVVGINTAIATVSGGFQGIGFAIPSNQAKTVYEELKTHGKVVRGWLGIGIADVDQDDSTMHLARYLGYQGENGVLVSETFPGTPASGKLFHYDIITGLNGQQITNRDQLRNTVAALAPNTTITLQVFRNQKQIDVPIILGSQPEDIASLTGNGEQDNGQAPAPEVQSPEALGMTLKSLDSDTAQSLGLTGVRSGAVITGVQKDSVAAQAGLQEGEVITEVGRTPVHNAQEAVDALKKADLSKGVPLYVATREGSQPIFVQSGNQQ